MPTMPSDAQDQPTPGVPKDENQQTEAQKDEAAENKKAEAAAAKARKKGK